MSFDHTKTPVVDCAKRMKFLKDEIASIKAATIAPLQAEHDALKYGIIPEKMEEMGVTTLSVIGLGRVTVSETTSAKTIKERKAELWAWLKDNGYAELITETVNSSTLAAFVREQLAEGADLPYDCLEITMRCVASITKK